MPSKTSNPQAAKIRPHVVAGNPRNRTRTPRPLRPTGTSSSYGSAKSSLRSRRNLRFAESETLCGLAVSETYLSSGASSTAVPRFDTALLCRKPEQGRENRHPENNPPYTHPSSTSFPCTLSGTHPFAANASSNPALACETLPAPNVKITSPVLASRTRASTASGTDLA
jgi:hypothetical protein